MCVDGHADGGDARWTEWVVRRNPLYLLSAMMMALGARWYLGGLDQRAGDVVLILLTLGLLQVYEWAVTAVLLCLHRSRRSPEDVPSLMLVAVVFWTGPLAAATELTVCRPVLGTAVALGAGIIAWCELVFAVRALRAPITLGAQLLAGACVVLLASAPVLVRVRPASGAPGELTLYAAWWVLAAIVGSAALLPRIRLRMLCESPAAAGWARRFMPEAGLVAITVAASAFQLTGMNHALFCHARGFYASPVLIGLGLVTMSYLRLARRPHPLLFAGAAALPLLAIQWARAGFAADVPVRDLHPWIREPVVPVLTFAALAWWVAAIQHRKTVLLHFGNVAAVLTGLRIMSLPATAGADAMVPLESSHELQDAVLFALGAYLLLTALIRRSRLEALIGLLVLLGGVVRLVWNQTDADLMITCLVAGWLGLIGLHVALRRPPWFAALVPVAFLAITGWACEPWQELREAARLHAALMIPVLVTIGVAFPRTRYVAFGGGLVGAQVMFYSGRWVLDQSDPKAFAAVAMAFGLLCGGALLSWHKRRVLAALGRSRRE